MTQPIQCCVCQREIDQDSNLIHRDDHNIHPTCERLFNERVLNNTLSCDHESIDEERIDLLPQDLEEGELNEDESLLCTMKTGSIIVLVGLIVTMFKMMEDSDGVYLK